MTAAGPETTAGVSKLATYEGLSNFVSEMHEVLETQEDCFRSSQSGDRRYRLCDTQFIDGRCRTNAPLRWERP